jgi:hypothetical protein
MLEDLARLTPQVKTRTLSASEHAKALHRARQCYHHLAGTLGVHVTVALVKRGILRVVDSGDDAGYRVDEEGLAWLRTFGIAGVSLKTGAMVFAPRHIDWSEGKPHFAGGLGSALAQRLFELQWLSHCPSSRVVRLTQEGKAGMDQVFGLHF